jgi:hypothetical protein
MAGTVICDYINSANVSGGFLGIGQTWQDMTASRASGVTYTNSTGKPIMVNITFIYDGSLQFGYMLVNGYMVDAFRVEDYGNNNIAGGLSCLVPNGASYRIYASPVDGMNWLELR